MLQLRTQTIFAQDYNFKTSDYSGLYFIWLKEGSDYFGLQGFFLNAVIRSNPAVILTMCEPSCTAFLYFIIRNRAKVRATVRVMALN